MAGGLLAGLLLLLALAAGAAAQVVPSGPTGSYRLGPKDQNASKDKEVPDRNE